MSTEQEFERRYAAWKSYLDDDLSLSLSSRDAAYTENEPFRALVALGEPAIPYMVQRLLCDELGHFLIHALAEITGYEFSEEEIGAAETLFGRPLGNQAMAAMWIGWWHRQQKESA